MYNQLKDELNSVQIQNSGRGNRPTSAKEKKDKKEIKEE